MFLIVAQVFLALLLVLLVLIQSPESDGLSALGGSQYNLGSVFGKGSPSSFVAKLTAVVAAVFIVNTLLLVGTGSRDMRSVDVVGKAATTSELSNDFNGVPSE
ncbi:preprotein translocase subunit SecG [Anaplasma bovis]|uniref:preprotein translocase subunit SecG n=1 Tax=Anaplasma bovis TaxID=186733 RepID=UPI002FF35334